MHQFIAALGVESPAQAAGVLGRALELVAEELSGLDCQFLVETHCVSSLGLAWATLAPAPGHQLPLLSEATRDGVHVLLYGNLDNLSPKAVDDVLHVYDTLGVEGVTKLDGSFTAVIADTHKQSVFVASDHIGLRCARRASHRGVQFFASHDLPLYAFIDSPSVDGTSVASVLTLDWSLEGMPTFDGITPCQPWAYQHWSAGVLREHAYVPLGLTSRLEKADARGIARARDEVVECLRTSVRHVCAASKEPVALSLTAGLDSRAMLALALSVSEPQLLIAKTRGLPNSRDVRGAKYIARIAGVTHEVTPPPTDRLDAFLSNAKLLAIGSNGESNAKRALTAPIRVAAGGTRGIGGAGGETLRGYYYREAEGVRTASRFAQDFGDSLLAKARAKGRPHTWLDAEMHAALQQRHRQSIERFESWSRGAHDVADLYYLFERYVRWGSRPWRQSWSAPWAAFSASVLRAAYQLPAPLASQELMETIIRRHLPLAAYLVPINGQQILALRGGGRVRKALRRCVKMSGSALQLVSSRLQPNIGSPDAVRGAAFAGSLMATLRELTLAPDSIALDVLPRSEIERLLGSSVRPQTRLQVLGALVTLEQWRKVVATAATWRSRLPELHPATAGAGQ